MFANQGMMRKWEWDK